MTEPGASPELDPASIRAVVFDVDGTLYDPRAMRRAMAIRVLGWLALRPWRVGEIRGLQAFRRHRETLADREAETIRVEQYRGAAAATGRSMEEVERVVEEWIHHRPLALLGRFRYPGVAELFARLRERGVRIAIWSDYRAEGKVAALGLEADLIVSAEDPDVDRMKPIPVGLERVLERWALAPAECLMVGDRDERDGEAARRLGVPYALLQRSAPATERSFRDFAELAERLEPSRGAPARGSRIAAPTE